MLEMIESNRLCVLATVSESGPHCSLMSYAASEDGTEFYMATDKNTKKYRNLAANPSVTGTVRRNLDEPGKKAALEALCRRHPDLKDFLAGSSVEVIAVKINSLQLLDGIADSHFEEV